MGTAKDNVLRTLRRIIAEVYEIPVDSVGVHESFVEMGLDSISIIQVKQLVKNTYGFEVPVHRLFDDVGNLDALAGFIMDKLPAEPVPASSVAVPTAPASPFAAPPGRVAAFPAGIAPSPLPGSTRPFAAGSESGMRQIINDQILIMHRQMEMLARMNS